MLNFEPVESQDSAKSKEMLRRNLASVNLDSALEAGHIPIISDAALRKTARELADLTVICWSHSVTNLLNKFEF